MRSTTRLVPALLLGLAWLQAPAAELRSAQTELVQTPYLFHLDGTVEARSGATVAAQTGGQVAEVLVDVDDVVEEGAVIIVLKDAEQRANVARAEANLRAAAARLQEARKEFTRIEGVYAKKLVAKSDLDKAAAGLKTARANHEAADAALSNAREQLEYTRVKAPYSGIVTERHVEVGEVARPGVALVSGISLDNLRVTVDVPQNLVSSVREGGDARVLLPDGRIVPATSITVFPIADPTSNSFKVRLDLPAGVKGLYPGMFVKTAFNVGTVRMLTVPVAAVVYRSEVVGAYVIDDEGAISFRHIRVGHKVNGDRLEVLSGLLEDERVALDPIAAGSALKAQRR